MTPLRELYEEFVREKTKNASQSELDCLLHPRKYLWFGRWAIAAAIRAKRRNVRPAVCLTQLK